MKRVPPLPRGGRKTTMRFLGFVIAVLMTAQERRGPLAPEEAVRTFRVPAGFRVELVAAEPKVVSPVALAFDEDGRLFVAEMRDYPLGSPSGQLRVPERETQHVLAG